MTARKVRDAVPPGVMHVYEPHRVGLPPLGQYVAQMWERRPFAVELSRAGMRAANTRTVFGQLWLVINPLLLASVYFVLVNVLSSKPKGLEYFSHLTAGLFVFYFVAGSMSSGAQSVVGGGKLLLNTAFPRLLMPMSAVRTAFFRWLPTVPVYLVFHVLAGNPWTLRTLASLIFLFMIVVFTIGLAALFATLQVYFRDTTSFLPYFVRVWLYLSPVILTTEDLRRFGGFEMANPLYALIGGFSDLLVRSVMPSLDIWLLAIGWSLGSAVLGSLYFISRERDFAVRV